MEESYFDRMVFNRKKDFTIGLREQFYLTDKLHLIGELHFSQRMDGTNPWARCTKVSFAPVLVPGGSREYWARPQLRFVTSLAFYNDFAKESLYSPYLQFTGPKSVGYYFGIKAEWWIFD
jgi:maltoporin